jgi:hypothetical protein
VEELEARGLSARGAPRQVEKAVEWARLQVSQGGTAARRAPCVSCGEALQGHLRCMECGDVWCRRCLRVDKAALFEIGFQCAPCLIEAVPQFSGRTRVTAGLVDLASELNRVKGAALKPATWLQYQRCISTLMGFARDHQLDLFPVRSTVGGTGASVGLVLHSPAERRVRLGKDGTL